MKCTKILEKICDELGENLDSPKCAEVKKHLAECPECCAHVDSLRKTVFLYRCAMKDCDCDVPEEVDNRLWKVLNLCKPETDS